MERQPVESSQIKSVGHDPDIRALEIEFHGGSVYRYDNVDQYYFDSMIAAESVGRYFGQVIKPFPDKFPFTKIRGTDREELGKALAQTEDALAQFKEVSA